ncbi:MAG: hypothetical protein QHJ82_17015, partial [Verrucomicrobiota bacterium]|nr:hypothetical protein [Verrucomicrobiota bacterium]
GLISALFPATESQGIFPSPAWLKVRRGARAVGVGRQATLVPAAPGWKICGLKAGLQTGTGGSHYRPGKPAAQLYDS